MPRHSHEDALTEDEFARILDAARDLQSPFDAEATFIAIAAGRLGMRAGEISHMRESWINWEKKQIDIPRYEDCTDGKDGGVCGYCRQQAQQAADHNDDLSFEEALAQRWEPKTDHAARAVPFDFDDQVEAVITAFFQNREKYPRSRVSVNRRVNRLLEAADLPREKCYPHALRATAGTYHAYSGLSAPALQSLMGWANLSVANKYIRLSGGATADALRDTHQG